MRPREVFHDHNSCRFEIYSSIDNLESWEQSGNFISSSAGINYLLGDVGLVNWNLHIVKCKIGIMKITFLFISKEGCENRNVIIIIWKHFRNDNVHFKSCYLFRILNYFFLLRYNLHITFYTFKVYNYIFQSC